VLQHHGVQPVTAFAGQRGRDLIEEADAILGELDIVVELDEVAVVAQHVLGEEHGDVAGQPEQVLPGVAQAHARAGVEREPDHVVQSGDRPVPGLVDQQEDIEVAIVGPQLRIEVECLFIDLEAPDQYGHARIWILHHCHNEGT
jgi:hypothetical protein